MPRQNRVYTNFASGEISPRLVGRTDLEKIYAGASSVENYIVLPGGGLESRPGTHYVAPVKTESLKTRLIPFVFSNIQKYVLSFGNLYFRVFCNNGRVESPPGTPVEVVTPYATADLFNLKFTQSADTLYVFHPSYQTQKITRTSDTAWTITPVTFKDGPYITPNPDTTTTITPSAATGSITLTASTGIFKSGHVGSTWRIKVSTTWGNVTITAFTSSTSVTATVNSALDGTTATKSWLEGLWSNVQGWPAWGVFHEQRLVAGGSTQCPQTIAASVSSDYENMSVGTVTATDAYVYKIGSNQVNNTVWGVSTAKGMQLGTLSQEFMMNGGSADTAITPTNVAIRPHSPHGSNTVTPVRAYSYTLFVQKSGLKLRHFKYDIYTDTYLAEDLTLLSEHITFPGIVDMCFQQEPYSAVWMVRADGQLVSCTYNPFTQMFAWARHTTPNGQFESVACVPSPDGSYDQVWVVVARTINGVAHRYVEYFDPALTVDCGLTYSGSPVSSVSGLTHLEGATAAIVGDGAVYPSQIVTSSGTVDLGVQPASAIQVGVQFTPTVTLLRPEIPGPQTGIQGLPRHWAKFWVRVYNTLGLQVGSDNAVFRNTTDPMGSEPAPFTGEKQFSIQGWNTDARITISQPLPLKSTVLSAYGILDVGDDDN